MLDKNPIYVALDFSDLNAAKNLLRQIFNDCGGCKIGMEFFYNNGIDALLDLKEEFQEVSWFYDFKLYDIPNTVERSIGSFTKKFKPAYTNIHASGGMEMMKAARDACDPATKLLAVTALTSFDQDGFSQAGYEGRIADRVKDMALLAQKAGLDGVVCSAHEIKMLRDICGPDFVLMVPGIRPAGANQGDQKRTMTPHEAMNAGATHLVIGRPVTKADNPSGALQNILLELGNI